MCKKDARPIWEIIEELGAQVPEEVWDKFQKELAWERKALPIPEQFKKVEAAAERACQKAAESDQNFVCVRSDLHCVEVLWVVRNDGDSWWQVTVEEADPTDAALVKFIRESMEEEGIEGIDVRLEW